MPVSTPVAPLPPVAAEQAPGPLLRTNPEIAEVLRQEAARRAGSLRPIATENFTRVPAPTMPVSGATCADSPSGIRSSLPPDPPRRPCAQPVEPSPVP